MIRFIKYLLIILLLISKTGFSQNQDLLNCDNSKQFAEYLFYSGQMNLAKHELERINYFCKEDTTSQLLLVKTYRKLGEYPKAESLIFKDKEYFDAYSLPISFRNEYVRLLMNMGQYDRVNNLIKKDIVFSERVEHEIGIKLLSQNWQDAYQMSQTTPPYQNFKVRSLYAVADKSYHAKRKNKFLATLMSAIIPGSGKMYCGYWGDGFLAFAFTASSALMTYRSFQKNGKPNAYTWISGGLAVSYYTANVYGGYSAAKRYNEMVNHQYVHETEDILYSNY